LSFLLARDAIQWRNCPRILFFSVLAGLLDLIGLNERPMNRREAIISLIVSKNDEKWLIAAMHFSTLTGGPEAGAKGTQ